MRENKIVSKIKTVKTLVDVKKREKRCLLNNKGITLIALVITVIVMLILARSSDIGINSKRWIIWKNK